MIRVDPSLRPGRLETIPVGDEPRAVAVGADSRLDPVTGEPIGEPIRVGIDPADVAIGSGSVWTVNAGDSTVTRIQP